MQLEKNCIVQIKIIHQNQCIEVIIRFLCVELPFQEPAVDNKAVKTELSEMPLVNITVFVLMLFPLHMFFVSFLLMILHL